MPWSLTNPCDYNYKGIKSVIEFFFNCSTTEVDAITIHFFNEWRKSICLSPLKTLMALSLQEKTQVVGYRRNFWLILNVINDIHKIHESSFPMFEHFSDCEIGEFERYSSESYRLPSSASHSFTVLSTWMDPWTSLSKKKIRVIEVVSLSLIIGSFFNYNFKERKRSEQRNVFAI